MVGKDIGNYRIISLIGKGGMGSVWLAEDKKLKRKVALKLISEEFSSSPQVVKRFKVEAIAQARLNHPNIIQIYSFEDKGKHKYIVIEYIDGISLSDAIKRDGKFPLKKAIAIFEEILSAMEYAHKNGIIHRDIKPANIILKKDGHPKIGDFGIAKVKGIEGLTKAGSAIGTPIYSSPEQITGKKIDKRTDIYSLGILFYEMLTGRPPFSKKGKSFVEIAKMQLNVKPLPPSKLVKSIPEQIDHIIMKCLEKSPDKRYQNVEDIKKDLLKIKKRLEGPKRELNINFDGLFSRFKNLKIPTFNKLGIFLKGIKIKKPFKILGKISVANIDDRKKKLVFIAIGLFFFIIILIAILIGGTIGRGDVVVGSSPNYTKKASPLPEIIVNKKYTIGQIQEKVVNGIKSLSKKQYAKIKELFKEKKYRKLASYTESLIKKGYRTYNLYLARARAYLYMKEYEKAGKLYLNLFRIYRKVDFIGSYGDYDGILKLSRKTISFLPEKKKKRLKINLKVIKKKKEKKGFKLPINSVKIKIKKPYLLAKYRLELKSKKEKYKVILKANKKDQLKVFVKIFEAIKGGKI